MRIGIFGGSFDPVHLGHLLAAEAVREACQLDEVWFVPAPSPPHKQDQDQLPVRDRIEMLELATAGLPQFVVKDLESGREGPSYTVDTLTALKQQDADRDLCFIMGADSLSDLPTWRQPERIAELAELAVVNRGFDDTTMPANLPASIRDRITIVNMPPCGVSSSDMRSRIATGSSIRFQTPRPVERLIAERGWYKADQR